MGRALGWMMVVALCCAATGAAEEPPDARLQEAQASYVAATHLQDEGKYTEAIAQIEHALALRETVLGSSHPAVADCLNVLGNLYRQMSSLVRAEPLLQRALAIRQQALGENHPDVAQVLTGLGLVYASQGMFQKAEPLYQRALAIREAALGKDHPDVAKTLSPFATLHAFQRRYGQAESLFQRALAIREAALGRNDPLVASSLIDLARLYAMQSLYDRAEPLLQRALAIQEAAKGKDHPLVASSLMDLGRLYAMQRMYDRAEPLFQRALAIREVAFGKDHSLVAFSLKELAGLYSDQRLYDRAEPLLQRALATQETALAKESLLFFSTLKNLADLYVKKKAYDRAEQFYQRALATGEASLEKAHPLMGELLSSFGDLYTRKGSYSQAEPLYQRALAIQEAAFGKDHPEVAESLQGLADLYMKQKLYARAEPLYRRALAIREATLGKEHPLVSMLLNSLATLYKDLSLYELAEPLYQRAIAIREATLGPDNPLVAEPLHNLAFIYSGNGQYAQAELLLERTLAIEEAAFGKAHPAITRSLIGLAEIYMKQGAFERAEALLQRALVIEEAAFSKDDPIVVPTLVLLATLELSRNQSERAKPVLERALDILERVRGKNDPSVAITLTILAYAYLAQEQYEQAEPLLSRALDIHHQNASKDLHSEATDALDGLVGTDPKSGSAPLDEVISRTRFNPREEILGELPSHLMFAGIFLTYAAQDTSTRAGDIAEKNFKLILSGQELALGKNHPDLAYALDTLIRLRLARSQTADVLPLLERALTLSEQRLRQEALGFSESRLASFLQFVRSQEELLYSLLRAQPGNSRLRRLALATVLLRKGRSVEETSRTSRTVFHGLSPEDRDTFERLRGLRTQLASLSFKGPGTLSSTAYQQRIKELAAQSDALESKLARSSAPLRALTALPPQDAIVDRVAATLPKGGALIEFVAYTDSLPESTPDTPESQSSGELRYLALVLRPDASIRALDLGPAAPIDQAASQLRDALTHRDATFQSQAQALYRRIFQPLLPLLGRSRRLFLSPDGQLSLIPFDALHDGRSFLIDSFEFSYLTSGKDLLPRPRDIAPSSSIVVLADPAFDALPSAPLVPQEDAPAWTQRSSAMERFFSAPRRELTEQPWPPLPGTRQEALSIHRLLPQAEFFLGAEATKQRLLELPTPGILHIATHGFFLEDAPAPAASRALGSLGSLSSGPSAQTPPDPLLRSGLVLTGAGAQGSSGPGAASPAVDSSLVTALELTGLNLWGTQLVVLSACDTGRGDIKLGQGVYGLRRALVIAGAETVVMSLWKVNDDSTRLLMEAYYRNLLDGKGRAGALRDAMRALRATYPHPHFWAPFIALGSDAPLRSLTPAPQPQPRQ